MKQVCPHCCFKISDLSVAVDRKVILDRVNIHINCGELLALVGPNGAGKTTLLKAILGEVAHTGRVSFRARGSRKDSRPRFGYVPQKLSFDTDSPVSVSDLIASGISGFPVWAGIRGKTKARIREALGHVQAAHLLKRRIGGLSGGELQRVLLAMALLPLPDIFLLDEPFTGVDPCGEALFYSIVDNLRREFDSSVILVTHDVEGIAPHADRIAVLNRTIVKEGRPQEVMTGDFAKNYGFSCSGGA
ncbi:MAG: metal ABC transporter ATP-binding protein [Deltaproteobacteria bacterium]